MSARDWDRFVRNARSEVLKRFGSHVAKMIDVERNELAEKPLSTSILTDREQLSELKKLVSRR